MLISLAIYLLPPFLIFKSSLAPIKGTINEADTYVTTVTDRRGRESQKSELIFYLNERKQKFRLVENIDHKYRNEKFENILRGLKLADTVTVWVKKTEMGSYAPKVFQIESTHGVLLDLETVRTEHGFLTVSMFFLGIGAIVAFLWMRFPKNFK